MTRHTRADRRGPRTGAALLLGLIAGAAVVGGGWVLLRPDVAATADLDEAEIRSVRADEPVIGSPTPLGGSRLPDDAPIRPPRAILDYRIDANGPQAAVYGLEPERARTWGFTLDGERDPERLRREIVAAIRDAGGTLAATPRTAAGSDFVVLTGTWKGMLLSVVAHRGETLVVTLIDR